MNDNYIMINGKRLELTEEQLEQLGIQKKENKRWRAKLGGYYYSAELSYLSDRNEVEAVSVCKLEEYSEINNIDYCTHNYFNTKDEVNKCVRQINTELSLRKYANEHNNSMFEDSYWELYYYEPENKVKLSHVPKTTVFPNSIMFSTAEIARQAIEEIGEDNVIKYITYEW